MSSSTTTPHPPPNPTQLAPDLPGVTRHITGHTPSGTAILESSTPGTWTRHLNNGMAFNVIYTTSSQPPTLSSSSSSSSDSNDNDIRTHEHLMSTSPPGLVHPHGTVARMVDFGPGTEPILHRTQSLDYGVVIEGVLEMELDEGVKVVMRRGDVAVQRGTIHGWRNVTPDRGWARMFFVLQDLGGPIKVGDGRELGEALEGAGEEGEAWRQRK